ncbi:MAG: LCP family protein [Clostridia bacterium]|nr:LCP family protein [Clostridia bacterium]
MIALIAFVVILALILALIAGVWLFFKNYKPSLDTDTPPFDVNVTPGPDDTSEDEGSNTSDDEYVRDTQIVNFLVAGRDKAAWNTDVMMLVSFNMRDYTLNVLQIPRDTYIEVDGVTRGRINTVVKLMRAQAYNNDTTLNSDEMLKAGMQGTVEILEKNLCVQIDGYAIVNLEGFRNIINAIGGVYMDVPYEMEYDDPDQDLYIHLAPGPQTLNGAQAEMFVRYRSGYVQGDIGRVNAQKIFLTALFKQLQNNLTISTVPTIVDQLLKYVTTDVPLTDIVFYAKELLKVDMENVSMMTLPGSDARSSTTGAWYYIMHRADMLDAINKYFNVYNKDITDELFDADHVFTDESYDVFADIYFAEATGADVETADKIDDGSLTIPLLP